MGSMELGQKQDALCLNGDASHAAMAALAVATATELGRWQSSDDFEIKDRVLELSRAGKRRCADGECWNTQALLDLQHAGPSEVELGGKPFNGKSFRRQLLANFKQQRRCDSRPGRGRNDCSAERHALRLQAEQVGVCDVIYTFEATTPRGEPLEDPAQLANKLVYAGYPENPYLAFTSTPSSVSIDPTYGLNEGGSSSSGSCSGACTKMSSSNISGDCCVCNGERGHYARSAFSSSVYLCK